MFQVSIQCSVWGKLLTYFQYQLVSWVGINWWIRAWSNISIYKSANVDNNNFTSSFSTPRIVKNEKYNTEFQSIWVGRVEILCLAWLVSRTSTPTFQMAPSRVYTLIYIISCVNLKSTVHLYIVTSYGQKKKVHLLMLIDWARYINWVILSPSNVLTILHHKAV